ncbi:MAG TPA: methyltransferase domain-containing protein [Bacteroidota bacterium]|nr:methyltransferase domain-containing protein [Bacteroidota bacterium]
MNENLLTPKPRTSSTGFDESKLSGYLNQVRYSQKADSTLAVTDYQIFVEARSALEKYVGKKCNESTILEIGCGQRFPTTLLFRNLGASVTGIDMDFIDPKFSPKGYVSILRANGFERFAKTLVRHVLYDGAYYSNLGKFLGKALRFDGLDIRLMDACNLRFPDNSFDYVFSRAVFEHIYDVEKASAEIYRVLKPGGIADIRPHLFPSLSGGHNPEWFVNDQDFRRKTQPWDHLRQKQFQAPCFLNKLREADYLRIFSKHFSIVALEEERGGAEYLTNEILTSLSGYTREELLKLSIRVIMKKEVKTGIAWSTSPSPKGVPKYEVVRNNDQS